MSNQLELSVYRELAVLYERQAQPQLRDRFLLLAAAAAQADDDGIQADLLRQRLLRFNPHHMLKPFASFAEALGSADVQAYLRDLKQSYPVEVAQQMLAALRKGNAAGEPAAPVAALPAAPKEEDVNDYGTLQFGADRRRMLAETRELPEAAVPPPPLIPRSPTPQQVPRIPLAPRAQRPASGAPPKLPLLTPVSPHVVPLPPREAPAPEPAVETVEPAGMTNISWIALGLFSLVLLLGLGLLGYTLAKPFLVQ